MQRGHNELVNAYNSNIAMYQQVLQHIDARVGMLMMAMDDQVRGEIKVLETDGKKSVNWPVYFEEYKTIVQTDDIKRKKAAEEASGNGNGESPLITPEPPPAEETVVEFGGT